MEKRMILIADDAEINREMLKFIFEEQYDIIEAEDGEQAIEIMDVRFWKISSRRKMNFTGTAMIFAAIIMNAMMEKVIRTDWQERIFQSGRR